MMLMMSRRAAGLCLLLCACPAAAQVLHERVLKTSLRCENGVCYKERDATAIVHNGELVPKPEASAQPLGGEPVYSAGGQAAGGAAVGGMPGRHARVTIDRQTGPVEPGSLRYHEPFNPAIFPYKRMSVLDAVLDDESLALADRGRTRRSLPVLGAEARRPNRDAFWGSIVVDLSPGVAVPLPSVAPDARILNVRTEPVVPLEFFADGADNQFVVGRASGRHRLIWLSDASSRYFEAEIPARLRIADEPRLAQPVPTSVKKRAQKVIQRLGLDVRPEASLRRAVDGLVAWFRAFSTGDPPPASGSVYLDLALGRRGSCRHRSYAFVVTALAMGIPARYVENELHVFVEVMVPGSGWRRINLGGAVLEGQVSSADGKVLHRPSMPDPFPQPPAFVKPGRGSEPPAEPEAPKSLQTAAAKKGRADGGGSDASSAGSEGGAGRRLVDLDKLDREVAPGTPGARVSDATVATTVSLRVGTREAFRGDRFEVAGVVTSGDGDAGDLPIEIYLDGKSGALRVADTVAQKDGSWRVTVEVPRDLPLGDHRVVARTPGDKTRKPSRSH
jgi:hypothetical protein